VSGFSEFQAEADLDAFQSAQELVEQRIEAEAVARRRADMDEFEAAILEFNQTQNRLQRHDEEYYSCLDTEDEDDEADDAARREFEFFASFAEESETLQSDGEAKGDEEKVSLDEDDNGDAFSVEQRYRARGIPVEYVERDIPRPERERALTCPDFGEEERMWTVYDNHFEWKAVQTINDDHALFTDPKLPPWQPNLQSGPKMAGAANMSPREIFDKLWPWPLWERLCAHSNARAAQWEQQQWEEAEEEDIDEDIRAEVHGKPWVNKTPQHWMVWFGLVMAMALIGLPAQHMYWQTEPVGAMPAFNFGQWMPRSDFMQMKKFMMFNNVGPNDLDVNGRLLNKMHYVEPIDRMLKLTFKRYWQLGQHVSVDEGGVPYKGKFAPNKCYNSNKPWKWFIKIWLLTCAVTAYCWNFKIYEGKDDSWPDEPSSWSSKFGKAERVILGLTKPLAEWSSKHFKRFMPFIVTCDRYFTSPKLCRALRHLRGMFLNGTVMSNRKNLNAQEIKLKKSDTARGFYKFIQTTANDLIACCWRDRNIVAFCSSAFGCKKTTTPRVTDKANGYRRKELWCPELCRMYLAYMGGCDIFDQLRLSRNYSMEIYMVSNTWWIKVMWGLFDMALTNAWIIYRHYHKGVHRIQFALMLHKSFLEEWYNLPGNEQVQRTRSKTAQRQKRDVDVALHCPEVRTQKARCIACKLVDPNLKRALDTTKYCDCCNVPLCIKKDSKCWRTWHLKLVSERPPAAAAVASTGSK